MQCPRCQQENPPAARFCIVRIDPVFNANPPSRVSGGRVTFEAGARAAWHTHPLGQTLIVTAGSGWTQQWGGQKRRVDGKGQRRAIPPMTTGHLIDAQLA